MSSFLSVDGDFGKKSVAALTLFFRRHHNQRRTLFDLDAIHVIAKFEFFADFRLGIEREHKGSDKQIESSAFECAAANVYIVEFNAGNAVGTDDPAGDGHGVFALKEFAHQPVEIFALSMAHLDEVDVRRANRTAIVKFEAGLAHAFRNDFFRFGGEKCIEVFLGEQQLGAGRDLSLLNQIDLTLRG